MLLLEMFQMFLFELTWLQRTPPQGGVKGQKVGLEGKDSRSDG